MLRPALLLMLCLSFIGAVGCSQSDSKSGGATKSEFWTWFDQNKDNIATVLKSGDKKEIKKTLDDVVFRMQKDTPGISFLFGYNDDDDEYEFVVTADGKREFFDNVKAFAAAAPIPRSESVKYAGIADRMSQSA